MKFIFIIHIPCFDPLVCNVEFPLTLKAYLIVDVFWYHRFVISIPDTATDIAHTDKMNNTLATFCVMMLILIG